MPRVTAALAALCLVAPLLAPLLALPAGAQERWATPDYRVFGRPATDRDAAAIDAVLESFGQAWAAENAEGVAALHADDVEWTNAYARIIRSSDALEMFLRDRLFPAFDASTSSGEAAALTPVSLRFVGADAAVYHGVADSDRGPARDGGAGRRRVHFHFVLERQGDDWRIAHTAIFDARR